MTAPIDLLGMAGGDCDAPAVVYRVGDTYVVVMLDSDSRGWRGAVLVIRGEETREVDEWCSTSRELAGAEAGYACSPASLEHYASLEI